jgi:hypothetical protein
MDDFFLEPMKLDELLECTLSFSSSLTLLMAEWLNRTPEVMGNIEGTHRWDTGLEARRQLPSCRQDLHLACGRVPALIRRRLSQ